MARWPALRTKLKNGKWYHRAYRLTVDWAESAAAESAGDVRHKCGHLLELDNGCFAIQPNNRVLWYEPSFVVRPFHAEQRPDYLTNTHVWKCETASKWRTEDTDLMHYDLVPDD